MKPKGRRRRREERGLYSHVGGDGVGLLGGRKAHGESWRGWFGLGPRCEEDLDV